MLFLRGKQIVPGNLWYWERDEAEVAKGEDYIEVAADDWEICLKEIMGQDFEDPKFATTWEKITLRDKICSSIIIFNTKKKKLKYE